MLKFPFFTQREKESPRDIKYDDKRGRLCLDGKVRRELEEEVLPETSLEGHVDFQ